MRDGIDAWLRAAWAMAPRTGAVAVEGATIRWRGWGLDHAERPGLLLVHGFRAHAHWWDHIAPHLADRYRVVALDLSGMGDSDRRARYSRRQMARELLAVADDAGLGARLTLVAHSFGGMVALFAARAAPDRIERALILDAVVFREDRTGTPPSTPLRVYPDRAAALSRFRLVPPGAWPDPAIHAYIAERSLIAIADGWTWKFDHAATESLFAEPVRETLTGLPTPVDMIYGANSEVVGADEVAAMRANLPNLGRPVVLAASHHHLMIEQPVALLAAIDALLANPRTA